MSTGSVEDIISISVPRYECEFTLPWANYRNLSIADFIGEVTHTAINIASPGMRLRRIADLYRQPGFEIYIPGGSHQGLAMDNLVGDEIVPGSVILLLTDTEMDEASGRERTREIIADDTAPQNLGPVGEMMMLGLLLAGDINSAATGTVTPLDRINARYRGLLTGRIMREAQEQMGDDDEDEEYVGPPLPPLPPRIPLPPGSGGGSDGPTHDNPISSGVKKVLNMETFNRVCPVVSEAEITSGLIMTTESAAVVDETDESIGGPQDAGFGACAVCLSLLINKLKTHEELRRMPNCTHIFHSTCLSQWLTQNSITCPVCRQPAVTDNHDYGYLGFGMEPDVYVPAHTSGSTGGTDPSPLLPYPAWIPVFPSGMSMSRGRVITSSAWGTRL